jgi:hypothetical protein
VKERLADVLGDFTRFYDTLISLVYDTFEFFYNERTNPRLTFFTDQTVVSIVGIVCVMKTTMGKSTMRLSSFITRGPIHTVDIRTKVIYAMSEGGKRRLTFFTDQTVVSIVGIVCVMKTTMGKLEFEEFVAMLARVSSGVIDMRIN